jgi:N-methylhydantoinase B
VRHLWRDYETDSGGAGAYRGNCGSLYRKQVLVPSTIYTYVVGKRYPMPGIAGGSPARRTDSSRAWAARTRSRSATRRVHPARRRRVLRVPLRGRRRLGRPLERPPERVLDDVLDEYVSVEGARRDYGVVLTGSLEDLTLAVDRAATDALRAEMRSRGR